MRCNNNSFIDLQDQLNIFRAKVCPKYVELILEINKTVIVASRWFLYYLNYKLRLNTTNFYEN